MLYVPNYLLILLTFYLQINLVLHYFSFVKRYTFLSPFAFILRGFVFLGTLAELDGIHFSIGKYLQLFDICLSLYTQLQICRARRCLCRRDKKHTGSTFQCQTSKKRLQSPEHAVLSPYSLTFPHVVSTRLIPTVVSLPLA